MIDPHQTLVLVIDVQGRLATVVRQSENTISNIIRTIRLARILDLPIMYSEQAPEKIGETIPIVVEALGESPKFIKHDFSCCAQSELFEAVKRKSVKRIVLAGIEAHVCVYQTALGLKESGYSVEVIANAVSSRHQADLDIALERMRQEGVKLTSVEMLAMELLQSSKHSKFRDVMKLIK